MATTPNAEGRSTSSKEIIIGSNNPLYLRPSDSPGKHLVEFKLTGTENYNLWYHFMRIALFAKNKFEFVNGTCKRDSFNTSLHDSGIIVMHLFSHDHERCSKESIHYCYGYIKCNQCMGRA